MATVARSYILYSSKIRPLGRCFTTTSVLTAGHSKWSTIKHDKAKEDVGSSASTDRPSADITTGRKGQAAFCYYPPNSLNLETYVHSRNETWQDLSLMPQPVYGPDPASNPQLAAVVATAKKQGVPKATIEIRECHSTRSRNISKGCCSRKPDHRSHDTAFGRNHY